MTVETEGVIPPEVANQVVESATAALEDLEKAKVEADEVKVDPAAPAEVIHNFYLCQIGVLILPKSLQLCNPLSNRLHSFCCVQSCEIA